MTTLIPKYYEGATGTVNRPINQKLQEFVSVEDFGAVGDGTTDDTAAIQAAINSLPVNPTSGVGAVILTSGKKFRITSSLVLQRGQSLIGDSTPYIIADFSSSNWASNYVAIEFLCETTATTAEILNCASQHSYGFNLIGINNSSVQSIGMKFYTNQTITVAQAINFAYFGRISDITIAQFDNAILMHEVTQTNFTNVRIYYCVTGVYINGKCTNVNFFGLQITNPSNSYSSSSANTTGIIVDSGFFYSDGEGRPEGLYFNGGLVYGHYNNVHDSRSLQASYSDMIIDGAAADCFVIDTPENLLLTDCYLFTAGVGYSCVSLTGVSGAINGSITIQGNTLVGTSPTNTCYGINFVNAGAARDSVNILGNNGENLTTTINALLCPSNSSIRDNYSQTISTSHIYIQNAGLNTIVDGNSTSSSVPPLVLYASSSDPSLRIGSNSSASNVTYFAGKATLLSGQTSVALHNNFYGATDVRIRPITQVTFGSNPGANWWVADLASNSDAALHVATAPGSNITVHYTVTAIPVTAY